MSSLLSTALCAERRHHPEHIAVTVNEAALVRAICYKRFYHFVQEFWGVVIVEQPIWNWHIEYLCDMFQEDAERVFRGEPKLYDTVVNIPPGTTKSTVLSIMAPAWIHARRPDMRVLAASHTQQLTFELGRKCRIIEESELYRRAFPEVVPSKDQWTKSLFINTVGGGRYAATVGGMSPTGFHAHFLLVDDPLDPQQAGATSEAEIDAANNFMSEVLPSRKVDKAIAVTWLIMQRLHQKDPTGYLLDRGKGAIRHICLPAERSSAVCPASLRRQYVDGLLDPVRLSRKILDEAKRDLGEFGFAGQYRQNPVPRGGGMFKPAKVVIDTPPLMGKSKQWVSFCRFWDKAGTRGGGAYTVGLLMGRYRPTSAPVDGSEDEWWILDVVRVQLDAAEREKLIVDTAKMDTPRVVIGVEQEPGSGGKESAQLTVKRLAGYRVQVVPAVGSKEERADSWASVVNSGSFRMKPGEWNRDLLEEMKHFPRGKYKDQIDAGAGAFTILACMPRRVGAVAQFMN
jgi:predicted phage terminase large subunit-like protein